MNKWRSLHATISHNLSFFLHLNAGARCFIRKSLPEDSTELKLESKPGFHTRARSCYRWDSKWILWPVLPSMLEMQRECTQDRKEPRTLPAVLMGLSALPISLCRWLYWLLCPITLLLSTSYLENNSIIRLSINRHESQNVKPRWKIAKNKYLTLNVDPRLLFDPSLVELIPASFSSRQCSSWVCPLTVELDALACEVT